jgi:diguanylate cyclase (GGDEF)-like protein/PAS domain S-box-containing protein
VSVLGIAAAFLLRQGLEWQFHITLPPFLTFYPAIMVIAVLCGLGPGLLATALAVLLSDLWIFQPVGHLKIASISEVYALGVFACICVFACVVSYRYRRYQQQVAALERDRALQETRGKLEAAMASMTDAVFISDAEGRFIDFNEAFATFHKFRNKAECAKTMAEYHVLLDIFLPNGEPAPPHRWPVTRALGGESATNMEYTLRRTDTGATWIGSYSFSPIRDKNGALAGAVVTARDITVQKEVEKALRASEERYRAAFESSQDAIIISSLSSERLIDVNQAFVNMTGWKPEEAIGHTPAELNVWDDHRDVEKAAEAAGRDGVLRDFKARFRRKDGSAYWGIVSGAPVEIGGVQCFHSVLRDISKSVHDEEALRASEIRYRTVFELSEDAIALTRLRDLTNIDVNQTLVEMSGYRRDEIVGQTSAELNLFAHPEDIVHFVELLHRQPTIRDMEVEFLTRDGRTLWGVLSASLVEIDGEPCALSFMRNITDLKKAQDLLRASEVRYRTAFQTSLDAITIIKLSDARIVDVNEKFLEITGFDRFEVMGMTSADFGFWKEDRERENVIDLLRQGSSYRDLQVQFLRKNGEVFWGVISASPMVLEGEACALSVIRDISGAKHAEEEIRTLAFFDPLTGLANRRMLMEQLRKSIAFSARSHRKRALLIVDLDDFKNLNDTLGHETGDLLLREVGLRISACVRESDTVGHLGGDEFVLLLEDLGETPEVAAAQAKMIAEKVLAQVDLPYQLEGRECVISCSIGITVFGDSQENINEVLQQADIAMYQAKGAGRNTLRFFAPELQAAVNIRASMEEDLRQGIKSNQFMLYYQPQVEDGRLIGAEALVRWNHPRLGVLLPGEFIQLAEQSRLILPLGNWVLGAACRQIAAWAGDNRSAGIVLAVNISTLQLRQADFVDEVLGALERSGANPRNLKLELTESMLVDDVEDVIAKMTVLRTHGLRFSVDDFGTGYSSLTYLKRLPLDQLKIDRSFVRDLLVDLSSAAIAQTIISLSQIMGLSVIAEGVETEEQLNLLAKLGCHSFQGYLFSPPVPLEKFEQFLPGFNAVRSSVTN